jgi:hypothetical protein
MVLTMSRGESLERVPAKLESDASVKFSHDILMRNFLTAAPSGI